MIGPGKRILCVDDEPAIVEYLLYTLARAGFQVEGTDGGWPALELIKSKKFDLVVTDVRMLKGDGIELLENIQALPVGRPEVVIVSAFVDVSTADILDRGAVGLLQKPIVLDQVEKTLAKALTPAAERWTLDASTSAVSSHVTVALPSWAGALADGTIGLGSGGLFVSYGEPTAPVDHNLAFELEFASGAPKILRGTGTIRWARSLNRHGFLPGLGLEILTLEPESRAFLLREIAGRAPRPFVPIGLGRANRNG